MTETSKLLVVDDEENLRHMLYVLLKKQGYDVDTAEDGKNAIEMALANNYEFILCDIRMPGMDGPGFLDKVAELGVKSTIIMMSAYGTIDTAIECMKLGAYDYVSKPFKNDEILLTLKKAEERERLKKENRQLRDEVGKLVSFEGIIGKTQEMAAIFELIRKVADFKTTVLILGDSGTGKELVARAIHHSGNRKNQRFIAINCGAIPENLLESELFGHVKGAFTDAVSDKSGLVEQADKGTLFLDEIAEMPHPLQVRLLRVLQEGEFRPVGAGKLKQVDVRVVSATSKDLAKEVEAGRFREDLFYRLNVFNIKVPPLRDRLQDIPALVNHFIAKHGKQLGKTAVRLTPEGLKHLMNYSWPGNVRELENCIERGLLLCDESDLDADSLPLNFSDTKRTDPFQELLTHCFSIKKADAIMEKELIRKALLKTGGNRTQAARLLEISHRALLYKLKEYGLE